MNIDVYDKYYTASSKYANKLFRKLPSAMRFIISMTANFVYPYWSLNSRLQRKEQSSGGYENKFAISLTTIPSRIDRLWLVIHTLVNQTIPLPIHLWLSKEQFLSHDELPKKLLTLQKNGLVIHFVDGDLKSHKKYYYFYENYPDMTIITADDDILYPSFFVEKLLEWHTRYPSAIIAHRASRYTFDGTKLKPYRLWEAVRGSQPPSRGLFFTTGGGTLMPFQSLHEDAFNVDRFMSMSPSADDIWLNAMAILKGSSIAKTDYYSDCLPALYLKKKGHTLSEANLGLNENDRQFFLIMTYYKQKYNYDIERRIIESIMA